MSSSTGRAFTLIELLVVISVIGILAGMLMPAISLVRESARKSNCGSNQRQIVMEMLIYATEYQSWPTAANGAAAQAKMWWRMKEDIKPFFCPSAQNAVAIKSSLFAAAQAVTAPAFPAWTAGMTSYSYDLGIPAFPKQPKPGRVVMADNMSGGLTVHKKTSIAAFADGHIGNLNAPFANPDASDANVYALAGGSPDRTVEAFLEP